MYSLNKLVWAIVNPAVLGVLLLVGGLLLSRRNAGRALVFVSLVWFVFWMLPVTSDFIGAPLEEPFLVDGSIPSVADYTNADAIVVLGGGMTFCRDREGACRAEMNANADRVWMGAELFKAGKAPRLFVTGGHTAESTLPLLRDLGVDMSSVEVFDSPRNTEEEARLLSGVGVKRILLVTSAWHMRRALRLFGCYADGVEVVAAPADWDFTVSKRSWDDESGFGYLKRFQPEAEAFRRNTVAFKEWLGNLRYALSK